MTPRTPAGIENRAAEPRLARKSPPLHSQAAPVAERARRIVRVFPRRTSMTPTDDMAFIGYPSMFRPEADEVHVSCTFTWDVALAKRLATAWCACYPIVKLGGPAFDAHGDEFTPGLYCAGGYTFTSRGCNNNCGFCLVPKREGRLRLLPVQPGHIIMDNNLLQTPRDHQQAVYDMLRGQRKAADFRGGLQASLVDDWVAGQFRDMRIAAVWLAADAENALRPLERAVQHLQFLARDKLRCYVLIGYGNDTLEAAKHRLEAVWNIGCLPFAMLYQPSEVVRRRYYSADWHEFQRLWARPAATKAMHLEVV